MQDFGKLMVTGGILLIIAGIFLWSGFGRNWLGRLPGDMRYQSGNFSFYFPVVTCIILSVVVSLLLRIFRK